MTSGSFQTGAMDRRAALRGIAAGIGATASALWVSDLVALADQGAHAHLMMTPGIQSAEWVPKVLSPAQHQAVAELAELIIPATDTPGAKAALVDRFIDATLETASPAVREPFLAGFGALDARSQALFQRNFVSLTHAQQTDLLSRVFRANSPEGFELIQFCTVVKSMTIAGYYTTEIGLRQELGDPGELVLARFDGCTHPEHQNG